MFGNKVGRPSNETIKKRKIFKIVVISLITVISLSFTFLLSNISTKNLKGSTNVEIIDNKMHPVDGDRIGMLLLLMVKH